MTTLHNKVGQMRSATRVGQSLQQTGGPARGLGVVCLLVALLLGWALSAQAQVSIGLESGVVMSGYNDVRVPSSVGTDLSLSQELSTTSKAFVRLRLSYGFAQRHVLSLLVAPLRLEASGAVDRPVHFAGTDFPAQVPLSASYRFDSYRLTYRCFVDNAGAVRLAVGLTAKVRDAAIRLEAPGLSGETTNTGFVPLLSGRLQWQPGGHLGLVVDADALAAPQGRAEDVLVALTWTADRRLQVYGGYRLLEGGADVEQVYNFALFHYVSLGAVWTF
ncbi:MAG: hypothetical protein H5U38_08005 [Calditrichaeota bacterium]|nr:hypothetical protein [Calditrichota bacterium]